MSKTTRLLTGVIAAGSAVAVAFWLWSASRADSAAPLGTAQAASAQQPATAPPPPRAATDFDSARAWEHLQQIVGIGPRPAGSAGIRQTRAYIGRQLAAMGLTVQEQSFTATTPVGRVEMANLIVRLPGRRPDRILFTGHYDTKLLKDKVFVGASDGGSSAAFLIELARALAARPQREFTYELVWLDGEEAFCLDWYECGSPASPDNTYGSRYYVQTAEKSGTLKVLRANILVDLIGDRDLQFRREGHSTPWLAEIVWNTARTLAYDRVFLDMATSPIEDDHVAFLKAGLPSVDIIDLDYPVWHTADDTLAHVSARSLQIVGDVVLASIGRIEDRLK